MLEILNIPCESVNEEIHIAIRYQNELFSHFDRICTGICLWAFFGWILNLIRRSPIKTSTGNRILYQKKKKSGHYRVTTMLKFIIIQVPDEISKSFDKGRPTRVLVCSKFYTENKFGTPNELSSCHLFRLVINLSFWLENFARLCF